MNKKAKKNLPLIIAFSLPVLIILGIGLATYLPSLFVKTDYDFIYASCNNYEYNACNEDFLESHYNVDQGELTDISSTYDVRLFIHDTEKNRSREISPEDAQELNLSDLLTSPDGITVAQKNERGGDFLLFYGSRSRGQYLIDGKFRKKLNIIELDDNYYRDNFRFVGWVLENE